MAKNQTSALIQMQYAFLLLSFSINYPQRMALNVL